MTSDAAADSGDFAHDWSAELLKAPPLIAPVRQFTYPQQIAGEEDALARGAFQLMIRPGTGASFLATCALGFRDPSMPTGVFACPNPHELCAVAGGYAYVIDTAQPERSTLLDVKPVVAIKAVPAQELLLFAGFHTITAWGRGGFAWETARLSWEGVHMTGVEGGILSGTGWNMMTDREVEFSIDLLTGQHQGGGFALPAQAKRS